MTQSLEVGSNSSSRYCPLKRKRCERSLLCSPYTNSTYSALLLPRWLLASQRYVPLSVLFSVVMVSSWPSTIMRSMSGSSPPSLDHSTDSGLEAKTRELLTVFLRTRRCKFLNSVRVKKKLTLQALVNLHWVAYGNTLQFQVLALLRNDQ